MSAPAAGAAPGLFLALPALVFVAIGAAIIVWPHALIGVQLRLLERQISWLKARMAPILVRAFGAFFFLFGLGFFILALTVPK